MATHTSRFRRNYDVRMILNEFPDNFLRYAFTVNIGSIDKTPTGFVVQIELISCLVDIGIPTPGHGS
jgi:hypothetical protein